MKKIYIWIFLSIALTFLAGRVFNTKGKEIQNISQNVKNSAEETLNEYIKAFIKRDMKAIMLHLPDGDTEKIKEWRNTMREFLKKYITDRRHIKSIVFVSLNSIKKDGGSRIAYLKSELHVSSELSGNSYIKDDKKHYVSYNWAFRQYSTGGAWFFDGGGF